MSVLQKDLRMTLWRQQTGPLLPQWYEKIYGVQKVLCLICNVSCHGHPMAEIFVERKKSNQPTDHLVSPSKSALYFLNN